MDGDAIVGNIIMMICSLFCSCTFLGISFWAKSRKDPMHFYCGTTIDPKTVSDIPAYNLANAKMWRNYSIPFVLSCICCIIAFFVPPFSIVSTVLLCLGCTIGVGWLIMQYRKIEKEFIIR